MPIPFIAIGVVAGVLSLGAAIHSTVKSRKWQKIHNEALDKCKATESETKTLANEFNRQAEQLGHLRVDGMETLKDAAEFLKKAKVKHRNFEDIQAIPNETITHWSELHHEALKSLGIGVAGIGGAAGAAMATVVGLYRAAGLLGVASTGARITTLSGAAAHSATLARLGGGALAAGGAGVAGGIARLAFAANVVAIPIGIAAATWGEWKAEQTKQKVEAKLKEFARAEAKMRRQSSVMKAGQLRITELKTGITESRIALRDLLAKSKVGKVEDAHQVYKLAVALAELLEQPVLTEAQKEVLQG